MFKCLSLIFFIILIINIKNTFSQSKVSTLVGKIDGKVRDSAYNHVLQSASLSIYLQKDTSLIAYTLADNLGEFGFHNLPTGIPLQIVASFVGYNSLTIPFTIPTVKNEIFREIILERSVNMLKEVSIQALPPVQMNGDTLEFNADAFKLDKNAVAEDLMRKLPGITMWGDGSISVNGREISGIKVNGKPFFGGDIKVATQNLPKDAIDKIQVYRKEPNVLNLLDSISEINIKLKKERSAGYFGKLASGYGNKKRFEIDGNINYFTPRTQIGIAGTKNNVNKIASSVNNLIRNNTYKGTGIGGEYQSDFNIQGFNKFKSWGFIFLHDFIPDPSDYKNSRLIANYFERKNNADILSEKNIITTLGNDSSNLQIDKSDNALIDKQKYFNTAYDLQKGDNKFNFSLDFKSLNNNNRLAQQTTLLGPLRTLQSENIEDQIQNDALEAISLKGKYVHYDRTNNRRPGNYDISYNFLAFNNDQNRIINTSFTSLLSEIDKKTFNRSYDLKRREVNHFFSAGIANLEDWIFGQGSLLGISIGIKNDIEAVSQKENNLVKDKNIKTNNEILNQYLTVINSLSEFKEQPSLIINKTIDTQLANRFQKILSLDVTFRSQFYGQKNVSSNSFQGFQRSYFNLLPSANVSFTNNQYGLFQQKLITEFSVVAQIPTRDQLFPLIDSANVYFLEAGNPKLVPAKTSQLSFTFNHLNYYSKNTFNYNLNVILGSVSNAFSDSTIIDDIGRNTHYFVNLNGNKFLTLNGIVNKSFKLENNHLQIKLVGNLSLSTTPSYINYNRVHSNNLFTSDSLSFYYRHKTWLSVNFKEGYSLNHSLLKSNRNFEFSSRNHSTTFTTGISLTKKINFGSDIAYNRTSSDGSNSINYIIWNAYGAYRFMSGNNLELKVSALDLLHQNVNIINYVRNNRVVYGKANILQQYFMLTISYYPRKFNSSNR